MQAPSGFYQLVTVKELFGRRVPPADAPPFVPFAYPQLGRTYEGIGTFWCHLCINTTTACEPDDVKHSIWLETR